MVEFQVLSWWDEDVENDNYDSDSEDTTDKKDLEYNIHCFGKTVDGKSVGCCITGFTPFFYVKLPKGISGMGVKKLISHVEKHYSLSKLQDSLITRECGVVERKDILHFNNNSQYKFLRLVFKSRTALKKAKYIFKRAISIPGVVNNYKFKLYESNFDPYIRFSHIKGLKMAGWCTIKNYKTTKSTNCDISVKLDRDSISPSEGPIPMANFLQFSWDIETYSFNGDFPIAKRKIKTSDGDLYPNEIFQIGFTCQRANEPESVQKYVYTLKKSAPVEDIIVKEFVSERDLIKCFVTTIKELDPDILYTYNGDGFDCKYLLDRSELLGIDKFVLRELSRLKSISSDLREEKFSSSAYGDNNYSRLYIPGRLSYDLLVHYKRGMKKYDSYKLDNIAYEILGENKHPVTAREMFKMYAKGDPKDIRTILCYCAQDTHLLQKLVDKQLILMSIIQLANVTFVPVSFMSTRGQTIKTYSQMLKKARELKFLVPDTNFNENNYPLVINTEGDHSLNLDDMGVYTSIDCGSQIVLEDPGIYKQRKIECKVLEILEDNKILVNADLDILEPMFNLRCRVGKKGLIIKSIYPADTECETSFTGACVLDPLFGIIMNDVITLDFASLYPTIIMGFNLDYSTFVADPEYDNLPGVDYLTLEWDDNIEIKFKGGCEGIGKSGASKGKVCGRQSYYLVDGCHYCRIHDPEKKSRLEKHSTKSVHYKYRIVQKRWDNENKVWINKGVMPSMLEDLYAARKVAKKEMAKAKKEGDMNRANNFDSLQLATKLALNSAYGYLGRTAGNLIKKELAQLVTYCGRTMINQSKDYMEGEFLDMIERDDLLMHTIELD